MQVVAGPRTLQLDAEALASLGVKAVRYRGDTWVYLVNSANVPLTVELDEVRCPPAVHLGGPEVQDGLELPALGVAVLQFSP